MCNLNLGIPQTFVYFPNIILQMTGRKGRVVSKVDGSVGYESRSKEDVPLEVLNIAEKRRFMDGEKVAEYLLELLQLNGFNLLLVKCV